MRTLDKACFKIAPDALGGGVGCLEFRPFRLQILQLVHEHIKVEVRHGWGIEHIITPAVLPENLTQLFYSYLCLLLVHIGYLLLDTKDKFNIFSEQCLNSQPSNPPVDYMEMMAESQALAEMAIGASVSLMTFALPPLTKTLICRLSSSGISIFTFAGSSEKLQNTNHAPFGP